VLAAWWIGIDKWVFSSPPSVIAASLRVDCVDVQFPLTVAPMTTVCGVRVGKGKASYACTEAQGVIWPRPIPTRSRGFRCQFTNTSKAPMVNVSMWIPIQFQSPQATVKAREELISLGRSLGRDTPFDLYVLDDSGWDPLVRMPGIVSVRLQGEIESKPVTVDYPGGEPASLSGFGVS